MAASSARDEIVFRDMVLPCRVGTLPGESDQPQPLRVRLRLAIDLRAPGRSDRLEDTLDYGAVPPMVAAVLERGPFRLLESVAEKIADAMLLDGRVEQVDVEVEKVHPPLPEAFGPIGIHIFRARRDLA
jgi:dihydroneopterin aldolase